MVRILIFSILLSLVIAVFWFSRKKTNLQKPEYDKLLQLIISGLTDEKGVHVETALTVLGALAGFSAQMAVREKFIIPGHMAEDKAFFIIKTNNGDTYYTGDILNPPLLRTDDGHTSVLKMTAEGAYALGARKCTDINKLVEHMASTYGSEGFGVPRLPPKHMPKFMPVEMLKDCWDPVFSYLKTIAAADPTTWPFIFAVIIKKFILSIKGVIDPELIVPLVLESALPMSRINPELICGKAKLSSGRSIDISKTELGKFLLSEEFNVALDNARKNKK